MKVAAIKINQCFNSDKRIPVDEMHILPVANLKLNYFIYNASKRYIHTQHLRIDANDGGYIQHWHVEGKKTFEEN